MLLSQGNIRLHYEIPSDDFTLAGEASSNVKKLMNQLGINPSAVKKTTVAMYEAEINAVIHAGGGAADILIEDEKIAVTISDRGPGIADLDLAMQEGYSTASDKIRELGFGAGMGLPNMKRYADKLDIETEQGKGTTIIITVYFKQNR
jgi:anti-sigma regulatory factor (Ser/Thr protein kinase)